MKRKYLHLSGSTRRFALLLGFIIAYTCALTAQTSAVVAADAVISVEDIASSDTQWKSFQDYSQVITSERIEAAKSLAKPNLTTAETALYTGYDKMLVYIQADLAIKAPIENIAANNFKKVKAESVSDPALTDMQESAFSVLYSSLVLKLINN